MVKQFYLSHRWDPNRYYHFGFSSNGNESILYNPERSRTGASLSDAI